MKFISKAALIFLFLAILVLLISGNLFSRSPVVIAGQIAAVLLAVWARRSFEPAQFSIHAEPIGKSLLSTGPYRFIRHPMYTAALLLLWTSILGHVSPLNVGLGLLVTAVIFVRMVTEEQFLQTTYPDYVTYAGKTKRIIPYVL